MKRRTIYCSACDREVQLVLAEGRDGSAGDPELQGAVCLDIGESCTGAMCPVCAVSPEKLRQQLAQLRKG
jgi:hypothetical protein